MLASACLKMGYPAGESVPEFTNSSEWPTNEGF